MRLTWLDILENNRLLRYPAQHKLVKEEEQKHQPQQLRHLPNIKKLSEGRLSDQEDQKSSAHASPAGLSMTFDLPVEGRWNY